MKIIINKEICKCYVKEYIKFITIPFALVSPALVLQFENKLSGASPFFKIICSIVSVCTPFVLLYILSTYKDKISNLSSDLSNLKEKISLNKDDYERQISYKNSEIEAIKNQHRKVFIDHNDKLRESALSYLTFLNSKKNCTDIDEQHKVENIRISYFFEVIREIKHHIDLLFHAEKFFSIYYYDPFAVDFLFYNLLDYYLYKNHIENGDLFLYKTYKTKLSDSHTKFYNEKILKTYKNPTELFDDTTIDPSVDDALDVICKTFLVLLRDSYDIKNDDYEFSLEPDYSPLYTYDSNAFLFSITKKYLSTMVDILDCFCEIEKGSLELKM